MRAAQLAAGAALGLLLRSPTAVGWLRHRWAGPCTICWLASAVFPGCSRSISQCQPSHCPPGLPPRPTSSPLPCHRRRGLVAGAAFAVQAAYWAVLATWDHNVRQLSEDPTWRPFEATLFAGLLYFGGPLVTALACATMLALMLRSDALHAAAASALGSAALRPAASLSYCLYLVHDHARLWGLVLLLPSGLLPGGSFQAWAAAAPVSSLVGLTAYTLLCGYTAAALMQRLVERRCG